MKNENPYINDKTIQPRNYVRKERVKIIDFCLVQRKQFVMFIFPDDFRDT